MKTMCLHINNMWVQMSTWLSTDWSLKLVEYFDWLSACLSIRSDISLSICIALFLCLNLYLLVYFSLLQSVSSSGTLKTFPPVCWSVCTHVRLPFCLSTSVCFWNNGFWQHCHLFSPFFLTSSNFYGCISPVLPLLTFSPLHFPSPTFSFHLKLTLHHLPNCFNATILSRHYCLSFLFLSQSSSSPLSLLLYPNCKQQITPPMPFSICCLSRKSAKSTACVCVQQ